MAATSSPGDLQQSSSCTDTAAPQDPALLIEVNDQVHLGGRNFISAERWRWQLSRGRGSFFCKGSGKLLWGVSALQERSVIGTVCRGFLKTGATEKPGRSPEELAAVEMRFPSGQLLGRLHRVPLLGQWCCLLLDHLRNWHRLMRRGGLPCRSTIRWPSHVDVHDAAGSLKLSSTFTWGSTGGHSSGAAQGSPSKPVPKPVDKLQKRVCYD